MRDHVSGVLSTLSSHLESHLSIGTGTGIHVTNPGCGPALILARSGRGSLGPTGTQDEAFSQLLTFLN